MIRDAVATSLPAVNNRNGTILGPLRRPRMKLREIFAVVFNVLANDRTGVLRRSRSTSAPTSLEQRLWFRQCQDFLETRIVAQRIPFPALSKVLKRDAVVSIIDRERCGEKMLDQLDRVIGIAVAGINQREKPLDCASVD